MSPTFLVTRWHWKWIDINNTNITTVHVLQNSHNLSVTTVHVLQNSHNLSVNTYVQSIKKRKYKQWWSTMPPISPLTFTHQKQQWWSTMPPISPLTLTKNNSDGQQCHQYHLSPSLTKNKKRPWLSDVGNPGPVLGQAKKCGGLKPFNRIPTLPSW